MDEHWVDRHSYGMAGSSEVTHGNGKAGKGEAGAWHVCDLHRDGLEQMRTATAKQSKAGLRQGTEKLWQRTAPTSAATARHRTASAKYGHAERRHGGESLRKGLARQGGEPPRHSKATHSDGNGRPRTAVLRLREAMRGVAWH